VTGRFQDSADVFHYLFGLFFNAAFHNLSRCGINRNLAGDVKGSVGFNGLAVRANSLRGILGVNYFFHDTGNIKLVLIYLNSGIESPRVKISDFRELSGPDFFTPLSTEAQLRKIRFLPDFVNLMTISI